jgi:colicin import membrane protein
MNQAAELIPFNPQEIKPFSEFESQLAKLKDDNSKAVFDYASAKGNKEARSHIFTIRKIKGDLERARKDAKDAALQYGRLVDSRAKEISGELDAIIEVHDKPLREIEEREAARVAEIKARIETLNHYQSAAHDTPAELWREFLAEAEVFALDDTLQEFKSVAAITKDQAITEIKARLVAREAYEAEQAELARLRAEAAERERQDHERKIAEQAAAKAKADAEAEAERQRQAMLREQEAREREQREEASRQALAIETAKREKAEAEERAAKAEQRAKENAEREQRERESAERAAAEKRETDKKHKAAINNTAAADLVAAGLTEEMARIAVTAIAKREVKHVSIAY